MGLCQTFQVFQQRQFQSTLPVWGATRSKILELRKIIISIHAPRVGSDIDYRKFVAEYTDFNPRSPCGERPQNHGGNGRISKISIHAPRVGSDMPASTAANLTKISIHAPRVGSDQASAGKYNTQFNFNPRSPCGERRAVFGLGCDSAQFQSTLPVWGATVFEIQTL